MTNNCTGTSLVQTEAPSSANPEAIRTLAVREENVIVLGVNLSNMKQDRDEPMRNFVVRLRGHATQCKLLMKIFQSLEILGNKDQEIGLEKLVKVIWATKRNKYETSEKIEIDNIEIEKVEEYKYLGQTIAIENGTAYETQLRIKAEWLVFGKYKEIFQIRDIPMIMKRQVFNQCILCQPLPYRWMSNLVHVGID